MIKDEMEKLSVLEVQSAEYAVCRGYLDWLTIIPWGIHSKERHDLAEAEKILEHDHYGLEDIKQRILEFIGVGQTIWRLLRAASSAWSGRLAWGKRASAKASPAP